MTAHVLGLVHRLGRDYGKSDEEAADQCKAFLWLVFWLVVFVAGLTAVTWIGAALVRRWG